MTTTTSTEKTDRRPATGRKSQGALELIGVAKSYTTGRSDARAVDDFTLSLEPGQFVTLLGPSGCGKTTTLRMIAGFETPTSGDIRVDGQSIVKTAPNKRPMSMVFQSYALFPHLSVEDNIAFGLKVKREPRQTRSERISRVMDLMGIQQYAKRFPHELSGGQQQRVAIARAVVLEPSILLFDEPLSNLDAKLRMRMREEIRSIQQRLGITSVFVTHDQSEALTMSDVVVVMREGRIEQVGTPEEIYHRPDSLFVASFLGTANFLDVEVFTVTEQAEGGQRMATIGIAGTMIDVPCDARAVQGGQGKALVRSENLHVGAPGQGIPGTVVFSAFDGAITRYTVETAYGKLQGQANGTERQLDTGTEVGCRFSPSEVWLITE